MIDMVKIIWMSWNKCANSNNQILKDNQEKIFNTVEEADAFIEELKQTEGMVHIHKQTYEYFDLRP